MSKYVISWDTRENMDEKLLARGFQVFRNWRQNEKVSYQQMLGRVDNRGGFIVAESESPAELAKDAALFTPFYHCNVFSVLDIEEFAEIGQQAIEFRSSIK